MLLLQQTAAKKTALAKTVVKDLQHRVAYVKGLGPPEEVESDLCPPVDGLCVAFPVRSVVKVNSQVFVPPHHLFFSFQNVDIVKAVSIGLGYI